jgi:sugar phosphate isomerase/epimerase
MWLGYNTNGFAHHRIEDALKILAALGYRFVAITLERDPLDPPDRSAAAQAVRRLKPLLDALSLRSVIETGSRFLLDPWRKHRPTLISPTADERRRRIEFLLAAIDVAAGVGADCVSLWSGAAEPDEREDDLWRRLRDSLAEILQYAESRNVRLAFEPEPGMFIDTMARFEQLWTSSRHPGLGLTLDLGHVHCLNDGDPVDHLAAWRSVLWNVHLEDMRRGVHEHLMFGEGEMDFPRLFRALRAIGYAGPVNVELSGHGRDAVEAARRAFHYLQPYFTRPEA